MRIVLVLVLVLGACSRQDEPLPAPQANLMGTVARGVVETDPASSPVRIEQSVENALWLGNSPTETATRELLRRTANRAAKQRHVR